jgi:hypothetical protein
MTRLHPRHKGTKDGPKKVVQHLHNQVEFWSRKI